MRAVDDRSERTRGRSRRGARRCVLLGALAALLLVAAPVRAGTHFVVELHNGVGIPSSDLYGAVGYALQGNVGVGWRWPGLPLRIYVLAGVTWTHLGRAHDTTYHDTELTQNAMLYALGLRGVLPVWGPLRLVIDVSGGYRRATSTAQLDGLERYEHVEDHLVPVLGWGLQYRLLRLLSLGIRNEWQLLPAPEGPDVPALAAGLETAGERRWQSNLLVTATIHF